MNGHRWFRATQFTIRSKRPAAAVLVAALMLFPSMSIHAAGGVRITTDPLHPVAGQQATISVQAMSILNAVCMDDPNADVAPYPDAYTGQMGPPLDTMEVHLHGPGTDEPLDVRLNRSHADPSVWEGDFVFDEAGDWSILMAWPSFGSGIAGVPGPLQGKTDTCFGAELSVVVLPAQDAAPMSCSTSLAKHAFHSLRWCVTR